MRWCAVNFCCLQILHANIVARSRWWFLNNKTSFLCSCSFLSFMFLSIRDRVSHPPPLPPRKQRQKTCIFVFYMFFSKTNINKHVFLITFSGRISDYCYNSRFSLFNKETVAITVSILYNSKPLKMLSAILRHWWHLKIIGNVSINHICLYPRSFDVEM